LLPLQPLLPELLLVSGFDSSEESFSLSPSSSPAFSSSLSAGCSFFISVLTVLSSLDGSFFFTSSVPTAPVFEAPQPLAPAVDPVTPGTPAPATKLAIPSPARNFFNSLPATLILLVCNFYVLSP
jgi:hypothetical protein